MHISTARCLSGTRPSVMIHSGVLCPSEIQRSQEGLSAMVRRSQLPTFLFLQLTRSAVTSRCGHVQPLPMPHRLPRAITGRSSGRSPRLGRSQTASSSRSSANAGPGQAATRLRLRHSRTSGLKCTIIGAHICLFGVATGGADLVPRVSRQPLRWARATCQTCPAAATSGRRWTCRHAVVGLGSVQRWPSGYGDALRPGGSA